jgi:hypothetical protein
VATNIGVHFFDMLTWIFGQVQENTVHLSDDNRAAGFLRLEKARVRWLLSIDHNDLPVEVRERGQRTFRSISVDGEEIEFSDGFADLHTKTYRNILSGRGYGLEAARRSIETVYTIRNSNAVGLKGDYHPYLADIARDQLPMKKSIYYLLITRYGNVRTTDQKRKENIAHRDWVTLACPLPLSLQKRFPS